MPHVVFVRYELIYTQRLQITISNHVKMNKWNLS